MDKKSERFIESHLTEMWDRLNPYRPSNWSEIVKFAVEDVEVTSDYLQNGNFILEILKLHSEDL